MTASRVIPWSVLAGEIRSEVIRDLASFLTTGGLAVLPTETRYALVTRADNEEAIDRLIDAKGRASTQPISVFLPSIIQINSVAHSTAISRCLADAFLPGPLTLVLNTRENFPAPITRHGSIGIRVSPEPVLQALQRLISFPLTATSANLSGYPECTTIGEIQMQLSAQVGMYVDDGPRDGQTSTVVDARGEQPVILRDGAISFAQIARALNDCGAAQRSPA